MGGLCDLFLLKLNHECNSLGCSPSIKSFSRMKCNASGLQNTCKMRSQNNMTGVKFKDKDDLEKKIANAQLEYGKKYWTALRYDQVNHKRGSQVNKFLTIN